MAGSDGAKGVWQGARWGRGSGGQEGQMVGDGGDVRVQEGQMAVTGSGEGRRRVAGGQEFKMGAVRRQMGAVNFRWG